MTTAASFDPVWQELQSRGLHLSRWPWDSVVSFVFRHAPRDRPRSAVRILEVGCGGGPNLWFCAREGFAVAGVDASEAAIAAAERRFATDGLAGDLRVADFTDLPFADASFDLAIDRGSITCCGFVAGERAVQEVRRVLVPGGRFLFVPYSTAHTSAGAGSEGPDGVRLGIDRGAAVGIGQLAFYDRARVEALFAEGWRVLALAHVRIDDETGGDTFAEWRTVCERA